MRLTRITMNVGFCLLVVTACLFPGDTVTFAHAAPAAEPITIREQYWQVLPRASWVGVDHKGDPWFPCVGGDVAASYDETPHTVSPYERMLLGDSSGRIWTYKRYKNESTRYYDGKVWHETQIKSRLAAEDDAGRVFLFDAVTIHVLDKGAWSKHTVFAAPSGCHARFKKDDAGRMWFWGTEASRGSATLPRWPGTRGVWVFNKGTWTNRHTGNGFPVDDMAALLPLSDGRFLIVRSDYAKSPSVFLWSPDRKLAKGEATLFAPAETARQVSYCGTDLASVHILSGRGGRSELFTVSADGAVTWLSEKQIESYRQTPKGIYENGHNIYWRFNRPPPLCPVHPHEVICQDRHGRIYFRHRPGVGVLWPKHEKPGDTLRVAHGRRVTRVFRDSSGTVWGQTFREPTVLVKWDGERWQDTPVKLVPHPRWFCHHGPPWHSWHVQMPVLLPGDDGTFLAVALRDVYQDIATEPTSGEIDWGEVLTRGKELAEKRGKAYWFEGWLHKNDKWIGPLPIEELLQTHRATLTAQFTANPKQTAPFMLQSNGKCLWAAYEGKVVALADGKKGRWELSGKPKQGLPKVGLCRLPDGRMLCSSPNGEYKGFQLHALSWQHDRIAAEAFPLPEQAAYSSNYRNDWFPYSTKNGDLWLWLGYRTCQFRDGNWRVREDLNRPMFEETDGSIWFLPGDGFDSRSDKNRGYRIAKGDATYTFPWPREYEFGRLTLTPGGQVHADCMRWHVTLSAATDPRKRRIEKARIVCGAVEPETFVGKSSEVFISGGLARGKLSSDDLKRRQD